MQVMIKHYIKYIMYIPIEGLTIAQGNDSE